MSRLSPLILAVFLCSLTVSGQTPAAEQRAIRAFNSAKNNPLELRAFLVRMPKGADLHMHLSGAVYAETFIQNAAVDNLCINMGTLSLSQNNGITRGVSPQPICPESQVPAASALTDRKLYDALIDSFSMRSFVASAGVSGHDQFFATFDRFRGLGDHVGEWLNEVATRAAAQNEQYLEIMHTPTFSAAAKLGYEAGWSNAAYDSALSPTGDPSGTTVAELSRLREQFLASPTFRDNIVQDLKEISAALARRNALEHCGQPAATAACSVRIRFLGQVLRAFPPQQVFAQTLLYFELASTDPDIVGINFVQPEDAHVAMAEYHRQMLMLDYLHRVYPKVHISLHAGELAPGLVTPAGLSFHIREAIDLGHAERIGHGVDVMQEDNPHALLKEMAAHHVMVEINLTSNDGILGIDSPYHPLPQYRAAHVPVALSTDDEGVSRIDLTHEYVRAAAEYNLGYLDLKNMARTSMEHSFLAGADLWQQSDVYTRTVPACAAQLPGSTALNESCADFLKSNDKAAQQWELEHRFRLFEADFQ